MLQIPRKANIHLGPISDRILAECCTVIVNNID